MKRLIAVLLTAVMILALCACAKEPTAEELYRLASEKSAKMEKIDAEMSTTGSIVMKNGGQEQPISIEVTGAIKAENVGKEGMRMAMPTKSSSMGISIDMNCYFADGWYMMEMLDQKIKTPMDMDEAIRQFANTEMHQIDYITFQEMTKDASTGIYSIPFTMDMEKALNEGVSNSAMEAVGVNPELFDAITWETCAGTLFTDKEGNLKSQQMAIQMTTESMGVVMDFTILTEVKYNEIGEDFTVDIPDPAEFTEVGEEEMGLAG